MKKTIAHILVGMLVLQMLVLFITPISGDKIDIEDKKEFENVVPDEIIIKFKEGVNKDTIRSINSIHGLSVISESSYSGFYRLKIPKGKTVSEMVNRFRYNPFVEHAEPNYIAKISMTPNDPYFSYQWHMLGLADGGINVQSAWDLATGTGTVVAIVDTGISTAGSDLTSTCFVSGYDFVNNDNDPTDDNGHGTHVAGTVAQSTNNGIGVCGVAFDSCLMPIKVMNSGGSGSYYDIIDGIYFAVNNGANIISMSIEGGSPHQGLEDALAYAYNNGVTCVAASGNSGQNGVAYPAAYDAYVIAVGATRYDKTRSYYSNYGSSLDVVAPGGDVYVDQNGDGYADGVLQETFDPNWGCHFWQGTSMATPHVSGVATLLYSNGVTSPDDIRSAIQNTAVDLGSTGWDIYYGYGLINAYNALQFNQGDNPPTCSITSPSGDATVSGDVTIEVTATDDAGVTRVDFYVDSSFLGSDTSEPYHIIWDSTTVSDGAHTLSATAFDTALQSTSDSINVIVDNINEPPVADAGPDQNVYVDYTVEFDGSGSYDPDEDIVLYEWDFGDGSPSGSGVTVSHIYNSIGIYIVILTVTDNSGLADSDQAIVTVEEAPLYIVEFYDSFEVSEWN
ncbi:MAG: S8 family serine peptidase, partial [Thermoplasmatales archaeon]|nr:S8 family serine peptidase [Thermoplasmatales archaeon]